MKKNMLILMLSITFCGIQCRKDAEVLHPPVVVMDSLPFTGIILDDDCVGYIRVILGQNTLRARDIQVDTVYSTWRDSLQNTENTSLKFRKDDTIFFNARKPTSTEPEWAICLNNKFPAVTDYGLRQVFITAAKK